MGSATDYNKLEEPPKPLWASVYLWSKIVRSFLIILNVPNQSKISILMYLNNDMSFNQRVRQKIYWKIMFLISCRMSEFKLYLEMINVVMNDVNNNANDELLCQPIFSLFSLDSWDKSKQH